MRPGGKLTGWLLSGLSLLLVVVVTCWDLRRSSAAPGPLHPVHAAVAELAGGDNCQACHRDGAVAADACTRCHVAIGAQLTRRTGLHGSLADDAARCQSCHPEHHGDAVPLLAPHAFPRAGVPEVSAYDHRHVDFRLTGKHGPLACERCHLQAHTAAPVAARYLGLQQVCASCHDDAHRGAFGAACEQCHSQQHAWPLASGFAHERFPLVGAHGEVACAACHAPGTRNEVPQELLAVRAVRACAACHDNPHGADGVAATALRLPDAGHCARCHGPTAWADARLSPAAHAELGVPLRGAHARIACAQCHGDGQRNARWPREAPGIAECAVCHQQPHSRELVAAATAVDGPTDGCAGCHHDADLDFAAGRITSEQHRSGGFDLEPPHADVACGACHQGSDRAAWYPGRRASDCRACHQDVHVGQFANVHAQAQCTDCHHRTHFVPHTFGVVAHRDTALPLTGAHDAVACTTCHRVVEGVRQFRGTPHDCDSCHEDIHRGRFDRAGQPLQVGGRQGCARCHQDDAFTPVVPFDHALWTGFELVAAHQQVACDACHQDAHLAVPPRRLGKVPGSACADCHRDPHLGQFVVDGRNDCRRCHDAGSWSEQHFDHQRDSRFVLDDVHRGLACTKCHLPYPSNGGQVVRYRPLGTTCGDCHTPGQSGGQRK